MPRQLSALLAVAAAVGNLGAGQADSTQAADTLRPPPVAWTSRLVPLLQDTPNPYRLHLPWDEWAHSDLVATAANPFVPADLRIGAAFLDGSLGQPIFSALNPSAVVEQGMERRRHIKSNGAAPGWRPWQRLPAYGVAPMQDRTRANQTYFFWDQGDFLYRDVQVGGAIRLNSEQSLVTAVQSRSHPGQYSLAGPSLGLIENSVLRNYLLDYQRQLSPDMAFNYTLLRQDEEVGLPWLDEGTLAADRRHNNTWAHGFGLDGSIKTWDIYANTAVMTSDLRTATDSIGVARNRLARRSLSLWAAGLIGLQLAPHWRAEGSWHIKQRHITDRALGFQSLSYSHARLGITRTWKLLGLYGGTAIIDGKVAPEGRVTFGSAGRRLALETEATSFLDYPHVGRRLTLDDTPWQPGPVALRRTTLSGWASRPRVQVSARLAQLSARDAAGDVRSAVTGGLALDWALWPDIFRLQGSFTGVISPDAMLFPTKINAKSAITLILPLPRSRARPFVTATAVLVSSDLAWWPDPLYADRTPIPPFLNAEGNTTVTAMWVNVEAGLKVANFELRARIHNPFGVILKNSPLYLPQPELVPQIIRRFNQFSLSWRFLPEKAEGG